MQTRSQIKVGKDLLRKVDSMAQEVKANELHT